MAKFKAGDYITAPGIIFLRVQAVIEPQDDNPIYAIHNYNKGIEIGWFTEYELTHEIQNTHKLEVKQPEWERWQRIKKDDMIRLPDATYVKVLSRIDGVVLLSTAPLSRKEREKIDKVAEQVEQLGNSDVNSAIEEARKDILIPAQIAHKRSQATWHTIEDLTLRNWELMTE